MNEFTDAELQAEIDRRKQPPPPKPTVVQNPDWSPLVQMVEQVTEDSIINKFEDDNFKHYVYEMAMTSIYGPDYFKWRNAQRWG